MRGLALLAAALAAAAAAAVAAPAPAAAAPPPPRWCGGTERVAADRKPDSGGAQIHVVYATPADGADRFDTFALGIARDLAAADDWWRLQDAGRTLRFDVYPFPGCDSAFGGLDIGFVRLAGGASAYLGGGGFGALAGELLAGGHPHKKYLVYYDGAVDDERICGRAQRGGSFALVYVQACQLDVGQGSLGAAAAVHEVVHSLGAVPQEAPHACDGHVCDDDTDLLGAEASQDPLGVFVLDAGRDDYYGHPGAWLDVQDSPFLARLDAGQAQVRVAVTGTGRVTSDLPGIECPPACTIVFDRGTELTLTAEPEGSLVLRGWSGACTGDAVDCTVVVDGDKAVTAAFGRARAALAVSVRGRGRVTSAPAGVACPKRCRATYDVGTRVVLRATPAKGWRFSRWRGCTGKLRCTVAVRDGGTSATAVFVRRR